MSPPRKDRKKHVANGAPGVWSPWKMPAAAHKELRMIPYDKGSRYHRRVYEITNWSKWSLPRRLSYLRMLCNEWARDPAIAEAAVKIIRQDGVEPRDHEAAWASLLGWCQRNIHYQNEPNERVQSPQYTLDAGFGDCDDMAILLACLGGSLRMPWRFTVSGRDKGGARTKRRWVHGVGPCPRGVSWTHIYLKVGWPPFKPDVWKFAEPTLDVPLGWDVISATENGRTVLPEMAGADMAGPDLAGLIALGQLPVSTPAPAAATQAGDVDPLTARPSQVCKCDQKPVAVAPWKSPVRFVAGLPWGQIVAAALPTVLSFYLINQLGKAAAAPKRNPRRRRRRRRR